MISNANRLFYPSFLRDMQKECGSVHIFTNFSYSLSVHLMNCYFPKSDIVLS